MAVNRDKPDKWKQDIAASVDLYNEWFMRFAPKAFRDTRIRTAKEVEEALGATKNLCDIQPALLTTHPEVLPMLRMCTCPPIARDRLIGLAGVSANLVRCMELKHKLPGIMSEGLVQAHLTRITHTIEQMLDLDIFVWLPKTCNVPEADIHRAATVVADRLCGAVADPIIRNAQEQRQLALIGQWLEARGYKQIVPGSGVKYDKMPPGTYGYRMIVPVKHENGDKKINIPIDTVIMLQSAQALDLPLLIEAKSAGDYTNVNKRRKEEATKMAQLRNTYGDGTRFILFLCGYFDSGYLGYEAAEGIDWVWEHRIDDLAQFGV